MTDAFYVWTTGATIPEDTRESAQETLDEVLNGDVYVGSKSIQWRCPEVHGVPEMVVEAVHSETDLGRDEMLFFAGPE